MRARMITLARAGLLVCIACGGLALGAPDPAGALAPPRPGEIAQLKAEGRYRERLENVLRIGNHLTSPALSRQLPGKLARPARGPDAFGCRSELLGQVRPAGSARAMGER